MNRVIRLKVLEGRKAVEVYREAHRQLRSKPWHRGIPEEHTPLLDKLIDELKKQGFNSLEEFFDASEELNAQELGFASREDLVANPSKKGDADREALVRMWR